MNGDDFRASVGGRSSAMTQSMQSDRAQMATIDPNFEKTPKKPSVMFPPILKKPGANLIQAEENLPRDI